MGHLAFHAWSPRLTAIVLYQIARVTPLGAAAQVMSYGWFGGVPFPWIQIGSMIAWTAVLTPLAVKLFKWR